MKLLQRLPIYRTFLLLQCPPAAVGAGKGGAIDLTDESAAAMAAQPLVTPQPVAEPNAQPATVLQVIRARATEYYCTPAFPGG